jgi:hypothetical protein
VFHEGRGSKFKVSRCERAADFDGHAAEALVEPSPREKRRPAVEVDVKRLPHGDPADDGEAFAKKSAEFWREDSDSHGPTNFVPVVQRQKNDHERLAKRQEEKSYK